jgi:predicted carbohydrate-binding protein with CBM5 and CBM33 domain
LRNKKAFWAALLAALTTALTAIVVLASVRSADAHGALQMPASRTYACYVDGLTGGQIIPKNPACAAAVAAGGTQPLYDWYGVLRSDGAGRTRGFIPDGQICSGGFSKYAAYDAPRADWPATNVQPGQSFDFVYGAWVPHPGGIHLYITNDTYDPTKPLTWANFEQTPFVSADPQPALDNGAYRFSGRLPTNKSGRHIIYAVWTRTDSTETFYGCSDVVFGGSTATPTPTPTPVPVQCSATAKVTNSWSGGFQGEATITNTGTTPINNWYVQWTMPAGVTLTGAWNGTYMQSGTTAMIHAASWNAVVQPGQSATAGFQGNASSAPAFGSVTCG